MNSTHLFEDDSYFLSATNPTATRDQREIEERAINMLEMPIIRQAREQAAARFRVFGGPGIPAEHWAGFDERLDEWVFHYLTLALNSDPDRPRVLGHGYGPPHEWFGHRVPGTRGPGTGDNPDCNYSFIPLDGKSRYELHVKVSDAPVGDVPMWVCPNLTQSINTAGINWEDVRVGDDGTFVITIDPDPPGGRVHHLQTTIDSKHLFIRDCRQDWSQVPNAYRIVRLDQPARRPLSDDEQTALAHRYIIDNCASSYGFAELIGSLEHNTHTAPTASTGFGGMPTQRLTRGRLRLAEDEAYVLTVGGDSQYSLVVVYDLWLMSGDWWSKCSSLNNSQSVANADGTHTYVFCDRDPGVPNWLDTLGRRESLFLHRWQLLPQTAEGRGGQPWANGRVVKIDNVREALPAETAEISPEERQRQLADRARAFEQRYQI